MGQILCCGRQCNTTERINMTVTPILVMGHFILATVQFFCLLQCDFVMTVFLLLLWVRLLTLIHLLSNDQNSFSIPLNETITRHRFRDADCHTLCHLTNFQPGGIHQLYNLQLEWHSLQATFKSTKSTFVFRAAPHCSTLSPPNMPDFFPSRSLNYSPGNRSFLARVPSFHIVLVEICMAVVASSC